MSGGLTEIETAARAMVAKLEEIEKDKSYQGIWSFLLAHGMHYDGPNWAEELIALRKVLSAMPICLPNTPSDSGFMR